MMQSTSIRNTRPALTRQTDFAEFWSETVAQLAAQKIATNIKAQADHHNDLTLREIAFQSLGGAIVEGYFLTHHDSTERPLVIHTHGYLGQCEVMWQWAKMGCNVFGVDIRGFGKSQQSIASVSPHGFVLTGIEHPTNSALRGAVCDFIRAYDVAIECLAGKPAQTIFYGNSFGGALALMAAAVSQIPDLLISAVPTFGWAEERRRLVTNGSGLEINQYLQQKPEQTAQVMQTLTYFDTMNFADLVNCPTLVGLGLRDNIVPAPTVYAIVNHLRCRYEVREFPVSHTQEPEDKLWGHFEKEWTQLALMGVPESFGTNRKVHYQGEQRSGRRQPGAN